MRADETNIQHSKNITERLMFYLYIFTNTRTSIITVCNDVIFSFLPIKLFLLDNSFSTTLGEYNECLQLYLFIVED